MRKSATMCNETIGKWCKNKHGASKIIDTFETYHASTPLPRLSFRWHSSRRATTSSLPLPLLYPVLISLPRSSCTHSLHICSPSVRVACCLRRQLLRQWRLNGGASVVPTPGSVRATPAGATASDGVLLLAATAAAAAIGSRGRKGWETSRGGASQRCRWCSLMTHKYRGCIVVLSINKSVEPNEERKVLMSGFDQGFTVNTSKQVFRGIW
jgi:hypothetical protein